MSIEFLATTLIIVATPGTGVIYTPDARRHRCTMLFPRSGAGMAGPLPYVAHELMHAVQFNMTLGAGTLCNEYRWMREGTAQWVQDYITDASYGFGIAPDDTEFQANTSLKAIETAAGGVAEFRKLWKQFALYNWNQGSVDHYKNWDGLTAHAALIGNGSLPKGETPLKVSVKHLAAKYLTFTPAKKLTNLKFTNNDPGVEGAGIQAIITYTDGTDKVEDWSDEETVTLCLQDPEIKEITLIFSNGNADTSNKIDFDVKWDGRADLCCTSDALSAGADKRRAVGGVAGASCPIVGTITYTETSSYTPADGCCPDNSQFSATIDVSMIDDGYGSGFVDDGSSYANSYVYSSSGRASDCDYQKDLSGGGNGLIDVGAGKLVEPGDDSLITGKKATRRELLVGVDRYTMTYTYSGSETYSNCANSSYNGTITIPPATRMPDDIFDVCLEQSTTPYLEFTGPEDSTTLTLNCAHTEDDTTWTLSGTLTL